MTVRYATPADLPRLLAMAESFVAESKLPGGYDLDRAKASLERVLAEGIPMIVAERDGEVVGAVIFTTESAWTHEPWAFVQIFYVMPGWRATYVARDLLDALCRAVDAMGCAATFAASTARVNERVDAMFTNLFARFGFAALGPTMMRPKP